MAALASAAVLSLMFAATMAQAAPARPGGGGGTKPGQKQQRKGANVPQPLPYSPEEPGPRVQIETNQGKILIELYPDRAPKTVANFLSYVDRGAYDMTVFSRVLPTFLIQGGGYDADAVARETGEPIVNEADPEVQNLRGTIAMARLEEKPDSARMEFYINVVDNRTLDKDIARDGYGYCVFGRIVEGMDTVDRIRRTKTQRKSITLSEWPVQTVLIRSVRRVENGVVVPLPEPPAATDETTPPPAEANGATPPNETPAGSTPDR